MARGLNFALYYAGWFACILGPAWGYPWSGTLIALALLGVHLSLARRRRDEIELMLWAAGLGTLVDSAQIALGLLTFPLGSLVAWLPPPWMIVLWMQFAGTFHFSLQWLKRRPLTAALFGAVGGPLAFMAGARLGVVVFHPAVWPSLLSLAVVWALAMPLLLALAARHDGREGLGEYVFFPPVNKGGKGGCPD
ncbi:MAG: DUF2878 domain-containing protein [Deltaproteobacteria bacterium]|nr:DUF2878 domain-containing protein [Deltaproteobacteria bacterium]